MAGRYGLDHDAMRTAARERKTDEAFRCAAAGKFSRFAKESGQDVRKMETRPHGKLDAIEAAWIKAGPCTDFFVRMTEAREYLNDCISILPGNKFSRRDVLEFCVRLAAHQEEVGFKNKAGLFLTALINKGRCKRYDVVTSHLAMGINYFGFYNKKTIFVHGDLGDKCGLHMEGGSITVDGDVGNDAGGCMRKSSLYVAGNAGNGLGWYLETSRIEVLGNAGSNCGMMMFSGRILVRGDVQKNCGIQMSGGDISVDGDIKSISSDITRGAIYHKGKLIIDK
jgi:hypothetical protein